MTSVIRTQIQLKPEQAEALKRLAAVRGVSMAALVREAVDRFVGEDEREARWERALSVVGKFRDEDGGADVAEEHDRYLDEAYSEWESS